MFAIAKTETLNLRVDPEVKHNAEVVLSKLGIPMTTAIDMYLTQISLVGGIPFRITLPSAPAGINADAMTAEELHDKLKASYDDIAAGNYQKASDVFAKHRKGRQ